MTWQLSVRNWAQLHGFSTEQLSALNAFGWAGEWSLGQDEPVGSFLALDNAVAAKTIGLGAYIAKQLCSEVDAAQAAMFGRRVDGVIALMEPLLSASVWIRLLRVVYVERLLQVLDVTKPPETKPPRALRVRAVADYFFSLSAVEFHRIQRELKDTKATTFGRLLAEAHWHQEGEGLEWTLLEGHLDIGPFRATALLVDPMKYVVQAVERQDACQRGETLLESTRLCGVAAAVSGGFFLYSEPDICPPSARYEPVGLLIRDGEMLSPPCFNRVAFVQRRSGLCEIGTFDLRGLRVRCGEESIVLDGQCWRHVTRSETNTAPRVGFQVSVAAGKVCEVSLVGGLSVPLNGFVIYALNDDTVDWRPGASVHFSWPEEEDPIENGVAGGPDLLAFGGIDLERDGFMGTAPPRTFSGDETGDCNLLPRMAVGLTEGDRVLFVAVDGRNFDRALGLTLAQMAELMTVLGCVKAMNLDGGSSKRMVVGDATRDIPTTEVVGGALKSVAVRPVRTALYWRRR